MSMSFQLELDTPIHRLHPVTKLVGFFIWTGLIFSFLDLRPLLLLLTAGIVLSFVARVKWSEIRPVIYGIAFFNVMNVLMVFLITPDHGTALTGQRTVLYGPITYETLFYAITLTVKYIAFFPIAVTFLATMHPAKLSYSLTRLGVPDSIAYAMQIAFRYVPDVAREVSLIARAQEMRGVALSKGSASIWRRFRNLTALTLPLLTQTLSRIDTVTNAMELRGYGTKPKRTWYVQTSASTIDVVASVILVVAIVATIIYHLNLPKFWLM